MGAWLAGLGAIACGVVQGLSALGLIKLGRWPLVPSSVRPAYQWVFAGFCVAAGLLFIVIGLTV
jgi:hypothetical protein